MNPFEKQQRKLSRDEAEGFYAKSYKPDKDSLEMAASYRPPGNQLMANN